MVCTNRYSTLGNKGNDLKQMLRNIKNTFQFMIQCSCAAYLFLACLAGSIFAEESSITPVTPDTINTQPEKRIKKFFCEFVWANQTFEFSSFPYTTVYNDGVDEYTLDIPEIGIKRNNQFGLSIGWLPLQKRIIEEALLAGFQFITGNELSGIQFKLSARHAFVLLPWLRLHMNIGASYNRVNLVIGSVGIGNRSGADFMIGPKDEYIQEGSDFYLYNGFFAAQSGGGLQFDIIRSLYIDISCEHVFYCNSNKWTLMVAGKDDGVKLPDGNLTVPCKLGNIENTGSGARICVGYRF